MMKGLSLDAGLAVGFRARPLERRRHQRVKVTLIGRYMLSDRREFPCQTIDMSPGGVALFAPVKGAVAERVVVYLDQLGRIEGVIARHLDNGFALALNVPLKKREKLAEQLTWLANRHALGMPEDRRHERIVPSLIRSSLKLPEGAEYLAKIIDVSLSGVAIHVDAQAPLGTIVAIGQTQGRVVRHFEGGLAVEFLRPLPLDAFDENIVL
jgi:hypothetical protein